MHVCFFWLRTRRRTRVENWTDIAIKIYTYIITSVLKQKINNKPQVIQTKIKLKSKIFISWQTKKLSENLLKNHVKTIFKAKRNQEKQKGNYFVHKEIK